MYNIVRWKHLHQSFNKKMFARVEISFETQSTGAYGKRYKGQYEWQQQQKSIRVVFCCSVNGKYHVAVPLAQ